MKILVAGASGFIGRRLVRALSDRLLLEGDSTTAGHKQATTIVCLSRNPESLQGWFSDEIVSVVKGDVTDYESLLHAMKDVDIAYYLVHSMEGSTREWRKFAERDRTAAENFARAAKTCGIKRIIYLGGLTHARNDEELSAHMKSRKEVGEILKKKSSADITIFRAAVILGQGGGSFQMLQYLVERLPVMVCPKWVLTKSQPIAVDDVVTYLAEAAFRDETRARTFDIGGPDVLSYVDMIQAYSRMINKKVRILVVPFLTPRLSSYWIDLVTPVKASLARPLVDSLVHEATVTDESVREIIPIKLKSFESAIRDSLAERLEVRRSTTQRRERTSRKINNRILMISLFLMAAIGLTYYFLDFRREIIQPQWLTLSVLWFSGIAFSIYFARYGTRLGAFSAGIIGWITLVFWLLDNFYLVFGSSVIIAPPQPPGQVMTVRNFLGAIIASIVIASSHNVFHKIAH